MKVVADQPVGVGRGAGDVAGHLLAAHPGGGIEAEEAIGRVAGLLLEAIEGHAAAVDPGRRAGLQPVGAEAQFPQGFGQALGRLLPGPARRHRAVAHPDAAAQEGAGGEDHGPGAIDTAEVGADADHPRPGPIGSAGIPFDLEARHHRLPQGEVGGVLQQLQHLAGVLAFVGLGPQRPHGGAAAGVEQPFLQGGGIGQPADHPAEGIHLVHQLALGWPPHRRVAGLPGDAVDVEGEQGGGNPQPGGGEGRLTAGMAAADHDQVEAFGGGSAEGHRLGRWGRDRAGPRDGPAPRPAIILPEGGPLRPRRPHSWDPPCPEAGPRR